MDKVNKLSTTAKVLLLFAACACLMAAAVAVAGWVGFKRYRELRAEQARLDSRVTAESDYDATADVVDEDYRFRLRWPGPGSKVMNAVDARRLSRDAAAAAFDETGCYGVVIVEDVPGAELEPMAELIVRSMGVESRSDEFRKRGLVGDKDAVLYGLTGTVGGGRIRYEGSVFLHQEYVYQLVTWHPAGSARDCYAWFTGAFSLLEGKVTGRGPGAAPDEDGIGWRVRAGAWRDAPYRLGIDPPQGFRVVVGDTLKAMNARALVGMSSASPQAHVLVFVSPAGREDRKRIDWLLREFASSFDADVSDETVPVVIQQRKVVLHRLSSRKEQAFEFLAGEVLEGAWRLELVGWYSANDRANARPRLLAGLDGLRFLDEGEAETLGKELLASADPQVLVGESGVLRGGVFQDFEFGITFRKPPGFWEMDLARDRLPAVRDPRVVGVEHAKHVTAFVSAEKVDAGDIEAAQRTLVASVTGAGESTLAPLAREVSPMIPRGRRTAFDILTVEGPWRYDVTTGSRDGRTVHLVAFGRREDMNAAEGAIAELSGSLAFGVPGLEPVRQEGSTLRDLRLGFEMSVPGTGWTSSPLTTPYGMKQITNAHMWSKGAVAISVVAVHAGGDADSEQFIVAMMEQEVARRLGKGNPGIPRRSETTLGGRAARELTWMGPTKVNLVLTSWRGTTYGVLLAQPLSGGMELDVVKGGLRLLE